MSRFTHLLLAMTLLGLQACAQIRAVPQPPDAFATVHDQRRALEDAYERVKAEDYSGADEILTPALAAPSFNELQPREQHEMLYLAGALALDLGDYERALRLLKRSTTFESVEGDEWFARLRAAYADDQPDAIASLIWIARDFPDTLAQIHEDAVFRLVHASEDLPEAGGARFALLEALYAAGWKPDDLVEPSDFWLNLARYHLERGDAPRAIEVSRRVSAPLAIIALRVDKRFEPVLQADGERLNVDKAARDLVSHLRGQAERSSRTLGTTVQLTYAMLQARQYKEALAATDLVIAQVKASGKEPPYDDFEDQFVWILDNRARALESLERWEEAAEQQLAASRQLENGRPNVNQAINLGELHCWLDRPADALAAIAPVKEASPYGDMQVWSVRLMAALAQGDRPAAQEALALQREHRKDAPNTFLWSLVRAGEMDEAAQYLIERLEDPKLRHDALVDIQQYRLAPGTPRMEEWRNRWRKLVERDDVRTAVARFGRIERYEIEP